MSRTLASALFGKLPYPPLFHRPSETRKHERQPKRPLRNSAPSVRKTARTAMLEARDVELGEQRVTIGTAKQQFAAVREHDVAVAVAARDQRRHAIHAHDCGAMDASELGRIEALLEFRECGADEMDPFSLVQTEIMPGDIDE